MGMKLNFMQIKRIMGSQARESLLFVLNGGKTGVTSLASNSNHQSNKIKMK